MGIRAKLRETFIDYSDLEKANLEIGYLKDLCDSKDKTIAYQRDVINIQGEAIKELKRIERSFNKLKEEINNEKNTKRKNTRLPKNI